MQVRHYGEKSTVYCKRYLVKNLQVPFYYKVITWPTVLRGCSFLCASISTKSKKNAKIMP